MGLADDATAALVNPAGLIGLTRKEVSIEGRFRRMTQPFLVGGRLSGNITGQGQDTIPGPDFDPTIDSGTGLSFVSVVIPRGRFRFAGFRHELIRLEQEFASRGVFQNHGFENRDKAFSGQRTLSVDTYGASAAIELPGASLGAGILVQDFSLGFEFDGFLHENGDFYGAPDPALNILHFTQDGDDFSVGAVVGVVVPVSTARDRRVVQAFAQIRILVLLGRDRRDATTDDLHLQGPRHVCGWRLDGIHVGVPDHDRIHAGFPLAARFRVQSPCMRVRARAARGSRITASTTPTSFIWAPNTCCRSKAGLPSASA